MSETLMTLVAPGPPPAPKKKVSKAIIFYLVAAGALLIGLGASGIYTRNQWTAEVQARNNEAARVVVEVVHPQPATGVVHLQLPGQAKAFTDHRLSLRPAAI